MATIPTAQIPAPLPLVEVRGLNHFYGPPPGGHLVLDGVDLTLVRNEIVGLLGRSGSGKSTLLRSIAGLIQPREGTVTLVPSADCPDPSVAMVFQTFALFPWLTVLENVELGLEAMKVPAADRRSRALAAIDLIGLDGFENAYPKELSGGMRQRVGLARALVVNPSLLLMDEPFSALDVLTAETLRTDLLDLWSEGRMPIQSILLVTHNIEEAVLMCDRILVFSSNPGRVVAEIKVDLPRPRDRLDPPFRALVDDIYARMTARPASAQPARDGLFPGTGIAIPGTRECTADLGKKTFLFGLCSCTDMNVGGTLTTDSFNSTTGVKAQSGSVGVSAGWTATTFFNIGGSLSDRGRA